MGAKHSYGAVGRGDTLNFKPETLKVITDPKHPLYDPRVERDPDEGMILSIMAEGILVPLIVSRDGDSVYITDGRQRWKAAIEANKRLKKEGGAPVLLPCVWKRGDEKKLYEISVATNAIRSGDSPLESARKMQHLAKLNGNDLDAVARAFGCTKATVKNHLALLECAPIVQKAVEANKIPATVATKLSKMPREEQVSTLEKMVTAGATRGAAAQKAARGKADEESLVRGLTATERKKMRAALSEEVFETLRGLDAIVAKAVAATLALVDGNTRALKAWPVVASIVSDAIAPKKSISKPKKAVVDKAA